MKHQSLHRVPLHEYQIEALNKFLSMSRYAYEGYDARPAIFQPETTSEHDIVYREEVIRSLGGLFGFDVQRNLQSHSQQQQFLVKPWQKVGFGFNEPESPINVDATVRRVDFSVIATRASVSISEVEINNIIDNADGSERERISRMILLTPYGNAEQPV